MLLSLITKDPAMAAAADNAGIDRVFIDLERLGKAERQSGRSLFLSDHTMEDIVRMKEAVRRSGVMVRIDSPHRHTGEQVEAVIGHGASAVVLPYFRTLDEAAGFLEMIRGRAVAALLVETPEAVAILPALCGLSGLGEIHIGLNDLSIGLRRPFLFDILADGTIDRICKILRLRGIPFGFGGIASLSRNDLPLNPKWVLAEQVTQGATRGWLSRTFRDLPPWKVAAEVDMIRKAVGYWKSASAEECEHGSERLRRRIVSESVKFEEAARTMAKA